MTAGRPEACSAAAFERRYRTDRDPWNFAASDYERGRYRATLDALPRNAYAHAFEPACSVGELTAMLAGICGRVTASDIAPTAVALARQRCAALPNVEVCCADVALAPPDGPFDLIVFSELGYYFEPPLLERVGSALAARLTHGGDFLAVHWLGESPDHALHGDAVHAALLSILPLRWLKGERHAGFRIDAWRRA